MGTTDMHNSNGTDNRNFSLSCRSTAQPASMICPVCGYHAELVSFDAARSWMEISCDNCLTFAITKDALDGLSPDDKPYLSGFYRHIHHQPMTMCCDTRESIAEHIRTTRALITRDFQILQLIKYHYQIMRDMKNWVPIDKFPAIAYAKNEDDLLAIANDAAEKGYVDLDADLIRITEKGFEWMKAKEKETSRSVISMRNEIFISHKSEDADAAKIIKDFLVKTGVPNERIFCSSLPGNDVKEKIGSEVKDHLRKAAINILILSRDYYRSAYCLNEAGVAWYLNEVLAIPFGLPEIDRTNMIGFLDNDYKLRRMDKDEDIAYLYDQAKKSVGGSDALHSVVTQEIKNLKEEYLKFLKERPSVFENDDDRIAALEAENVELRKRLEELEEEEDDLIDYDDDIWEDGYHKVKNGDGRILKEGVFENGHLIDGTEYDVVLKIVKGSPKGDFAEDENEEPVRPEELGNVTYHYAEYGQYEGCFLLLLGRQDILDRGLEFFYIADKKVKIEGKRIVPTFTHIRTLESVLAENEPDVIDEIKTGVKEYEEAGSAYFEIGDEEETEE